MTTSHGHIPSILRRPVPPASNGTARSVSSC
jgi:hypothetical protein